MAILKVPRITENERLGIILQSGEIVFDIDEKKYFGGDDIRAGGFPLGEGTKPNYETREITIQEIEDKNILLLGNASTTEGFGFHFINGTSQVINIDFFLLSDNIISWENMGLDGFIEAGDLIKLEYY